MTKALQIKLLAAILATLGVIGGLIARGGRRVDAMSAQPMATAATKPINDDHEKQYRRFVAPSKKAYLIP